MMATIKKQPAWQWSIKYLKGVGAKLTEQLKASGVQTIGDVLLYFPDYYIDPATVVPLNRLQLDQPAHAYVGGRIKQVVETFDHQSKARKWQAHFAWYDDHLLTASWPISIESALECEMQIDHWTIISGRLERRDGRYYCEQPQLIPLGKDYPWPLNLRQCVHYPNVAGMKQIKLRSLCQNAVMRHGRSLEHIATHNRSVELVSFFDSLVQIHLEWPVEQMAALNDKTSVPHQQLAELTQLLKLP